MPAWKRGLLDEPNPTIVRRLMDYGAIREGGRDSLRLAAALANVARDHDHEGSYPLDAVAGYLRQNTLIPHVLDDPEDVVIVAGEVVDIVRAHGGDRTEGDNQA